MLNPRFFLCYLVLFSILVIQIPANAAPAMLGKRAIQGAATILDGDTLRIGDVTVRLDAIDAPEKNQRCQHGTPALQYCGKLATKVLHDLVSNQTITCHKQSTDRYGRWIGRCYLNQQELSRWMVAKGYALAFRKYSARLIVAEEQAAADLRGIWQTDFEPPWSYRANLRVSADQTPPEGCVIKGNISRSGAHIFHTPEGSPHYERTRINTAKGERWFCTENEALMAGWRPPMS